MVVSYANRAGTERHIATLGGELAGRGWQVAVLSPPGPATEWWQEAGLYVLNYDPQAAGIRRMIGSLRRQTEHCPFSLFGGTDGHRNRTALLASLA